ncbi:MAG: hypothetical protein IKR59_08665, partial [Lachnospiraceae bacterium]|nr:hypothetical protein [Lachnospiraceae bacterium]
QNSTLQRALDCQKGAFALRLWGGRKREGNPGRVPLAFNHQVFRTLSFFFRFEKPAQGVEEHRSLTR